MDYTFSVKDIAPRMEMDCISFFTIFSPHVNSGISVKLVSSTGAAAASPVRDTPYKELDTIPEVECPPHAVPQRWHVPAEACMRSRLAPTGHPPTARG